MTVLRTLKKLILGETWLLPIGIATVLGLGALVAHQWRSASGFLLLVGVLLVLLTSVARGARRS